MERTIAMWEQRKHNKEKEQGFLDQGISRLVARLLAQRDISVENVASFLESSYKSLSHPHRLHNVKEAAQIFCDAILQKKSVAVIGDYDCDGVMSSVMIKELCNCFKRDCKVFLPSRFLHGYGLTRATLDAFKATCKKPPYLLIIVDCGSNNEQEIQELKEFGIQKIIIIDHHVIDKTKQSKSADAFVSWHLSDYHEMCAAGEVFQFIRGIRCLTKKINPVEFLSYAALGTLGDVIPIVGDNRIIVKHGLGLHALNHIVSFGLISLLKQSGVELNNFCQDDALFKVVPKVNAAGRLQTPKVAYNLFLEKDPSTAELVGTCLTDYNTERKRLQKKIEEEAIAKAHQTDYKNGILVYDPSWNIGVVGIVASRLVETFNAPSIVVGLHNGILKGSGRSLDGLNIKEILDDCKEMLNGYGGHRLAAGVSIKKEYIERAPLLFDRACEAYRLKHGLLVGEEVKYYDAKLKPAAISKEMGALLRQQLYPYCKTNNPEPVFLLSDIDILSAELKTGDNWRLLKFEAAKNGQKIPFGFMMFTKQYGSEVSGRIADIYFSFPQLITGKEFELRIQNIVLKG